MRIVSLLLLVDCRIFVALVSSVQITTGNNLLESFPVFRDAVIHRRRLQQYEPFDVDINPDDGNYLTWLLQAVNSSGVFETISRTSETGKCGILDSCILRCGDLLAGPPYVCSCDANCILYQDCCFDALKFCPKETFVNPDYSHGVSTCKPSHVYPYYGYLHDNDVNTDRFCTLQEPPWCEHEFEKGIPTQSLSLLLNFGPPGWNKNLLYSQNYGQQDLCPNPWEIWDPFSDICRPVMCGENFKEENGKCIWDGEGGDGVPPVDDVFRYETTSMNITVTAFALSGSSERIILKLIERRFLASLAEKIGINVTRFSDLSLVVIDVDNTESDMIGFESTIFPEKIQGELNKPAWIVSDDGFELQLNFTLNKCDADSEIIEKEMEEILSILNEAVSKETILKLIETNDIYIRLTSIQRWLNREEHYFFEKWCRGGDLEYYWNEDFELVFFEINATETSNYTVVMNLHVLPTDIWYDEGQYVSNILYQSSDLNAVEANYSGVVVVCENRPFILDESCPRIALNESEFSLDRADSGILYYNGEIEGIKRLLNYTDYYYDGIGNVVVCIDVEKAKSVWNPFDPTLIDEFAAWLSFGVTHGTILVFIVLTLISLAALLVTIIVYIICPELRTAPGWCLVNFCGADFVFFFLFIFGLNPGNDRDGSNTMCVIIAMLLHYSSILLFVWSTLIAFDLHQTFTKWQIVSTSRTNFLRRYIICGYSIPGIIVFACLMLEFHSDEFKPNYGDPICWFGSDSSMVALYFFAIPIAICILINFTLFIITVIAIRKTSADASSHLGLKDKARFRLFARMSSVMCFGWIFGFMTVGFQWDYTTARVFEFLFIIINALQGLYVFCAFVLNDRVKGLIRRRLNGDSKANRLSKANISPFALSKRELSRTSTATFSNSERFPKKSKNARPRRTSAAVVERSVSNETCMSELSTA